MSKLEMIANLVGCGFFESTNPLRGVDVDKEYKLILEKKCKLPRSKRDLIIKLKGDNNE